MTVRIKRNTIVLYCREKIARVIGAIFGTAAQTLMVFDGGTDGVAQVQTETPQAVSSKAGEGEVAVCKGLPTTKPFTRPHPLPSLCVGTKTTVSG